MTTIVTWKQGLVLPHDPNDIDDIEMDLSAIIGDDALADVTVTGTDITAELESETSSGVIVFRVSGGTAGDVGTVTVQATMDSGRKQSRTVNFNILER